LSRCSSLSPRHPGVAHYLIHSYDYPPIAEKGLAAAKRYSVVAADAAHAQHMPSHIFTRVGLWRESVASNKASAATDVGVKAQTPHAWDYMVYAYLQLGDDAAAEGVWTEAMAVKPVTHQIAFSEAFGMAAIPSRLALERGRWAEAMKVGQHPGLFGRGVEELPAGRVAAVLRAWAWRRAQRRCGKRTQGNRGPARDPCHAHGAQARLLGRADRDPGGDRDRVGAARGGQERRGARGDAGRRGS
jgi:hypothetical protein